MFKQLAGELVRQEWEPRLQNNPKAIPNPKLGLDLFKYHPVYFAGLLEDAWAARFQSVRRPNSVLRGLPRSLLNLVAIERPDFSGNYEIETKVVPDHLTYVYMIENTRIYEIIGRVLREFLHGERLDVPSDETQQWLRATEELFYRDTPPFFAFQLTSYVRPDIRASRRNAYYRMFGMDLTHGFDDGRPYPYEKPAAANRDFVPVFERFLAEIWRGIINVTNTSGPRTTDDFAIADLANRLSDMLRIRR